MSADMSRAFDLSGSVAIVTGASRGIGQGIALGLAQAGADISGVSTSSMDETAELVAATGRRFVAIQANLSTTEPINRIIDAALDAYGRIDILVNNAGTIRRAEALDFSEEDWDDVMNVNLRTVFFLCQAFARYLRREQRGGKIINTASILSFQGGILIPSYTASKSGLQGITRLLANEWAKYDINVNAIAPGYIATPITAALRADETRNSQILTRIPAGRWGEPSDLAGVAVFLASAASAYVHGSTFVVDGGWLAR